MSKDTSFHTSVIAYLKKIYNEKKKQLLGATEQTALDTLSAINQIEANSTGNQRSIDLVESTTDGSTDAGVQSVSLLFRGNGGTLEGVSVGDNFSFKYNPSKGEDTIGSINYTVPVSGESRVIISYIR